MLYLVVSFSCCRRVVPCSHLPTGRRIKPTVSLQSAVYPILSASLIFSPCPLTLEPHCTEGCVQPSPMLRLLYALVCPLPCTWHATFHLSTFNSSHLLSTRLCLFFVSSSTSPLELFIPHNYFSFFLLLFKLWLHLSPFCITVTCLYIYLYVIVWEWVRRSNLSSTTYQAL